MPSVLSQTELFALLDTGQTVLVPHLYAARVLRSRYTQHNPLADAAHLLAWPEWTASLWSTLLVDGHEDRVVLNRVQEHQLWLQSLSARKASPGPAFAPTRSQAQLAGSGLRLAAAYNAADRLRTSADTPDTITFAAWADAFREQCGRAHLLPAAFLNQALTRHLRAGTLRAPATLHLLGFERLTPAQHDLLSALQAAGAQVWTHLLHHVSSSKPTHRVLAVADAREQLQFAACRIAQQASPTSTFALVTARAEEYRPELERFLREALAPELDAVTADLSSTPWQFASRPLLTSVAAIPHALDLLRWTTGPLSLERIGRILLSPYFRFSEPWEQRVHTEAYLRSQPHMLRPELDLDQLLQLIEGPRHRATGARFPELRSLASLRVHATARAQSFAASADHVRSLLSTLGWPGPRALSATEFAATEAWDGLLDLLSTLDLIARPVHFRTFLQHLEAELAETGFAAPGPVAPIQVLSLAETEALAFDQALLLDATDTQLPAPEPLHPLIAKRLQRSLGMPGATPAATYSHTRQRLQALHARCNALHLLAPRSGPAGQLRPTRLAEELGFTPTEAASFLPLKPPPPPAPLQTVDERSPLPPLPSPEVHGGARVLELQSACGFRAFAEIRLRAVEPPASALGLSPREAGSRLHDALQKLWDSLKDSDHLRSLPTSERLTAIHQAVQKAFEPLVHGAGAGQPWSSALLRVLEDRFTYLLKHWLELETERAPFTPLAREEKRRIALGPLQLDIRPDRIDQVEGGLVYIDYKTSFGLSSADWLGDRPDAPQLPLYTLLGDPETLRGVAFAHLRPGKEMGWHALSDTPQLFRKSKAKQVNLEEQIALWRTELTRLAQDFADGAASVDPKSYPGSCKYCAHRLLCRLDPMTLLAQAEDIDSDDPEESSRG